jgi:hypothetical protein
VYGVEKWRQNFTTEGTEDTEKRQREVEKQAFLTGWSG